MNCFIIEMCMVLWNLYEFSEGNERISYDGHSLLRVTPITKRHLDEVSKLHNHFDGAIDIWLGTTAVNHSADILVSPLAVDTFRKHLKSFNIPHRSLIDNIERILVDAEESDSEDGFFMKYNEYSDIEEYLENLALANSKYVSTTPIGFSYEGRSLHVLRITTDQFADKPAIWIQAGAHARERISSATVLYMMTKLIHLYQKIRDITKLLDAFDWYFLPILNPDGYEYCKIDPLWRKTRSRHFFKDDACIGVDANRNWNFKWNDTSGKGASSDPCSTTYAGPRAFSEPETWAASSYLQQNLQDRLLLFIDFHSYSQKWLAPWGYTSVLPPNYAELKHLAEIATRALESVNGTKYLVGSSGNDMYTVSGGARDWAYGVMGAKFSYVVELRDKGEFGFLLPPSQILPTAIETFHAIKAMGLELIKVSKASEN